MSATFNEAKDEILALFKTAWDTTGWLAIYPNVAGAVPTAESPWARVTIRNEIGGDEALGGLSFERLGTLTVQVFIPAGEGLSEGYNLTKTVIDAYDGKRTTNVWFRNGRINEVGESGDWYQFNVLVDFVYSEVK